MLTVRINGEEIEGGRKYAYAIMAMGGTAILVAAIAFLILSPFIAACAVWPT